MPAYNEGGVIAAVIRKLHATFEKTDYDFQIIVIDDGSKDNTLAEAKRAGAFTIKHILNTGSGGATATGLSYAQRHGFDIACTCDADGQHDPNDVLRGVDEVADSDIDLLIGSRLLNSSGMSRLKVLGNKGLTWLTRLLFGIKVTDSQSGLRVLSSRSLQELRWRTTGYEFCSEMLWRARQLHLTVGEFPIQAIYTEYSKLKGQSNWNAVNIIKALLTRRVVELFSE
jgi:glycosyltransferase involved in cell wall biosynthesis